MSALEYIASFVLVGLALQLAAQFWPVRRFERSIELPLDTLALVVALVSQILVATAAFPGIARLQQNDAVWSAHQYLSSLPLVPAALFYFLVVDFLAYWVHRLNHTAALWSTHAFHHSTQNIYWASGMRGSPIHYLLLAIPGLLVQIVFSPQGPVLSLVLAYGIVHDSLIHSNVNVPGRLFNRVFVTGKTHFVHHGRDPRLGNSNFGFLFTFWDRMFGTYVDPATLPQNYPLGLPYEIARARLVLGLPAGRQEAAAPVAAPAPARKSSR